MVELEIHAIVLQVIEDPARGPDDDMRALLETLELRAVGDTAVDRQGVDAAVLAELVELLGDLVGELAGREQDDGLGLREAGVDGFDQRDAEGAGLAAAGHRLDDQISAGAHPGNGRGLDRGRGVPTEVADGLLDIRGDVGKKFTEFSHIGPARYPSRGAGATEAVLRSRRCRLSAPRMSPT